MLVITKHARALLNQSIVKQKTKRRFNGSAISAGENPL